MDRGGTGVQPTKRVFLDRVTVQPSGWERSSHNVLSLGLHRVSMQSERRRPSVIVCSSASGTTIAIDSPCLSASQKSGSVHV